MRGMRFQSADELFAATRDLVARLEREGHDAAAAELLRGYDCLNGLTDGWAQFLESLDRVRATGGKDLGEAERRTLEDIRSDVGRTVYGR